MDFELPEELAEVQKLAHDLAEFKIAAEKSVPTTWDHLWSRAVPPVG